MNDQQPPSAPPTPPQVTRLADHRGGDRLRSAVRELLKRHEPLVKSMVQVMRATIEGVVDAATPHGDRRLAGYAILSGAVAGVLETTFAVPPYDAAFVAAKRVQRALTTAAVHPEVTDDVYVQLERALVECDRLRAILAYVYKCERGPAILTEALALVPDYQDDLRRERDELRADLDRLQVAAAAAIADLAPGETISASDTTIDHLRQVLRTLS